MPHGKTQRTLATYRQKWDALLDKTARLMTQREAAGIPLRGGSVRKSVRHISADYRESIAPRELKLAA
jgi:hypothetical protein